MEHHSVLRVTQEGKGKVKFKLRSPDPDDDFLHSFSFYIATSWLCPIFNTAKKRSIQNTSRKDNSLLYICRNCCWSFYLKKQQSPAVCRESHAGSCRAVRAPEGAMAALCWDVFWNSDVSKESTSPGAQLMRWCCISTLLGSAHPGTERWILFHALRDYLENLAPKSQNWKTFKNLYCRLIFCYPDWKPKQKPSSDFFFFLSWNPQLGRTLRALVQAIWPSPHEKSVLFSQFAPCSNYL